MLSQVPLFGNTPTGVGKTPAARLPLQFGQKHPHGRGEDSGRIDIDAEDLETPPRAWGRLDQCLALRKLTRNTPTGVGKTMVVSSTSISNEKHPHGRGEDTEYLLLRKDGLETPPRAWGRLLFA